MTIAGKLIGAIVGLILFRSPVGFLLGVLVGHFYDIAIAQLRVPTLGSGFVEPLFALAGALSKSDGRVSEVEIAAAESLMGRLRLDGAQRRAAIGRFNAGKQTDFPVHLAIADLRRWCGGRRDLAFLVLDLLLDLVYAEGALVEAKLALVRKLCASLGVSDQELAALSAMKGYAAASPGGAWYGPGTAPPRGAVRVDPYAVLGLERSAGEREIKRAYRKLMSQHHPDKLGNVPDELKRRAEDRAREINAAYERIKSERGFK
jgi:DnaJ like chaperone protein